MTRQGYGAECLVMDGCADEESKQHRLEHFMASGQQPCLGCGARRHSHEMLYSGHAAWCSLVVWWRKWGEILEASNEPQ